ncbi:MAG: EAL domain-containing protein [Vicinamibacterales bacterium]|nr:EAL domain-containing protein [Vicinamibacterales bacterium]
MSTPPAPPSPAPAGEPPLATAGSLALPVEPARPYTPCQHVFERFFLDRRLLAIPVVDEGRPVALVGRYSFIEAFRHGPCRDETALPHRLERHLGDPPRLFDETTPVDDLAEIYAADGGRELADGLLVTRDGAYLGVIPPHVLVRALAERGLARRADRSMRDERTGLANRALFEDRLVMAVAAADRSRNRVAALVLDLRVPDALGGEPSASGLVGDAAARFEAVLRHGDTVARLGHGRLGIILPAIGHVEGARLVGRKLLDALEAPFSVAGHEHRLSPALGLAVFPDDAASARRLVECAARAADQAAGALDDPQRAWGASVTADPVCYGTLRDAIEQQRLSLVYQPQLDLVTARPCGVEALVRWTEAGGRGVPANEIIEVAESSGLMAPLTEWVLATACAQMRAWHGQGVLVLRLAVNVSGAQARHHGLPALVERVLGATGLPPAALELEFSEQALSAQGRAVVPALAALRALGVRVAVDDFACGGLPIRELASLPVDAVKLDRSVIARVGEDDRATAMARAAIAMAHELGLKVIAEGVETAEQARVLAAHRCDVLQGFHVSPPLAPAALAEYVRADHGGVLP